METLMISAYHVPLQGQELHLDFKFLKKYWKKWSKMHLKTLHYTGMEN